MGERDPLLRYGVDPNFPNAGETELDHELDTLLAMNDHDLLHVMRYTNMRRTVEIVPLIIGLRCATRNARTVFSDELGLI